MELNNIVSLISAITTSTLGMIGLQTTSIPMQMLAFVPAVASELYYLVANSKSTDESIKKDITKVLEFTYSDVKQFFMSSSNGDFFKYAYDRIDAKGFSIIELNSFRNYIQNDLEIKSRSECVFLTPKDKKQVEDYFIDSFTKNLYNFPNLGVFLNTQSVIEHESRIEALEGRMKEITPKKESNKEDDTHFIDDLEYFIKKYTETLFLHSYLPKEKRISLKDIYINPSAETVGYWRKFIKKDEYQSIKNALKEFLDYRPQELLDGPFPILFIEGQAAMGKSSLISWLCWNYKNQTQEALELLNGRKIITIKFRDLPKSRKGLLNLQEPFLQMFSYLTGTDENVLEKSHNWMDSFREYLENSLLILEGFDELCMVEDIFDEGKKIYFQNLYNNWRCLECDCKIIVTTRPSYLEVEKLDFTKAHISICPFSRRKKEEWIIKYERKQHIDDNLKFSILQNDSILNGIIDSPLTMYMIVAKKIDISKSNNLWDLYRQVFADEVYQRNYEKGNPHCIEKYRKQLHALTAEIANALSLEQHFSTTIDKLLTRSEIREIINNLEGLDEKQTPEYQKIKRILEDCFGLASYLRISRKNDLSGQEQIAVEFYHNNIKDFFYCEYLWMNLERIYLQIPLNEFEQEKWFMSNFQNMFKYSVNLKDTSEKTTAIPLVFFQSKIECLKEQNKTPSFIKQELQNHYFQHFFGKMLETGMLYKYNYTGHDNILNMIACIFAAVFSVYRSIYLPFLSNNETIVIAEKEHITEISASFIFRILFIMSNIHDQSYINFDGILFSGISFGEHNFQNSSFVGCLLLHCNFADCDLRGANLSYSSLEYADLSGAMINERTKFYKASFKMTKVRKEQKHFFDKYINDLDSDQLIIVD